MRPIRVAIVGAGPAGIYAADILTREHEQAHVDVIERLPAPYGLVRYGVAPDHPRIKEIIKALRRVLDNERIRFFGNVDFGSDLKLDDLRRYYDAVIFSTGAMADRQLDIPGIDLPQSYGAADFVSWYAGHPDVPREWPLEAESVAVLVAEEGFEIDDAGQAAISAHKGTKLVVDTLLKYLEAEPTGAPHQIHIHMMQNPVEVLGEDGRVVAIRTERTEYNG